MHAAGRKWMERCRETWPWYFQRPVRVLELGSFDINGSARAYFDPGCEYVGVDWRAGPGVDIVSLSHKLPEVDDPRLRVPFDVLISSYTLEHDPHWKESLTVGVQHLALDGAVFLSWGAARCRPHQQATAPDGKFHALQAAKVLALLPELGLVVHEFWYEAKMWWVLKGDLLGDGFGEVAVVAGRDASPVLHVGGHYDPMIREDWS